MAEFTTPEEFEKELERARTQLEAGWISQKQYNDVVKDAKAGVQGYTASLRQSMAQLASITWEIRQPMSLSLLALIIQIAQNQDITMLLGTMLLVNTVKLKGTNLSKEQGAIRVMVTAYVSMETTRFLYLGMARHSG